MESRFKTASGKVALFSVMIAVTVITNLIMVPMSYPLAQYDLSPVLIHIGSSCKSFIGRNHCSYGYGHRGRL